MKSIINIIKELVYIQQVDAVIMKLLWFMCCFGFSYQIDCYIHAYNDSCNATVLTSNLFISDDVEITLPNCSKFGIP